MDSFNSRSPKHIRTRTTVNRSIAFFYVIGQWVDFSQFSRIEINPTATNNLVQESICS